MDDVRAAVDALQTEVPPGTEIQIVRDTSTFIRESVADVYNTLILGGFLTIVIVFLFLNSWRSTVITGLTLPISVISSFIVMYFLGMTINTLTLMALSLAIGLLIDDAIVVRENIVRHLEKGQDHFEAAREGTAEIGLAVLATSMSIIAVFVPVAFMKGIIGRFFYQFGLTVAFAVLGVAVRVVHARPDAVVALARPGHRPDGEAELVAPAARRLQRLVRADGRRLQARHRLGARPPD